MRLEYFIEIIKPKKKTKLKLKNISRNYIKN
jgi:hypothetical protein